MANTRILIIEDDLTFSDQLATLLNDKGFETKQCHDGQNGLLTALADSFDLILLDVLLPSLDGFFVLDKLRKVKETPVMMITACGAEEERIKGYTKGADDYLPKPFSFTEMLLRIDVLLRRTLARKKTYDQKHVLSFDGLTLKRSGHKVTYEEQYIDLTPIQFRLLWTLVENSHQVLSKPYLYQLVLDRAFSQYDRSLDMHLSRIRKKLVEVGMSADCLTTVHGKGYRFA